MFRLKEGEGLGQEEYPNEECQDGRNARDRKQAEQTLVQGQEGKELFTEQGGRRNSTNLFPFHVMVLSSSLEMRKLVSSSSLPG